MTDSTEDRKRAHVKLVGNTSNLTGMEAKVAAGTVRDLRLHCPTSEAPSACVVVLPGHSLQLGKAPPVAAVQGLAL